eukprot:scaffold69989_cov59-Phaeocystis_antarctica.AAC.1
MLPRVAAVGPAVVGHSCLVVDALTTHGRRESSRPAANSFTPNFLKVVTDFETESKQLTATGTMERRCMSARATPGVPVQARDGTSAEIRGVTQLSRVYRAILIHILGGFGRLGRACPGHGEALREKIEGPARRLRHTTLSGIVHLQKPHLSTAVLTRMLCASSQAAIRAIRSRDVGANMSQSVEESID